MKSQFKTIGVPMHDHIPMKMRQRMTEGYARGEISKDDLIQIGKTIQAVHELHAKDDRLLDENLKPIFAAVENETEPAALLRGLKSRLDQLHQQLSREPTGARLWRALAGGIKEWWGQRKRKRFKGYAYHVTVETRPSREIPRPKVENEGDRHYALIKRVVGNIHSRTHERELKEFGKPEEKRDKQLANLYDMAFHTTKYGTDVGGFRVTDPSTHQQRLLTEEEKRLGVGRIIRNHRGKELVQMAVLPVASEGKLVGHEVHLMQPLLWHEAERLAKTLARFYKHNVRIVAYTPNR